ncbi:hypothetical protein [Streptomyces sp. NPDC002044]|uniref:hypothetical protein n=1 Tax=Streptomyces sp. NPDC002044 TaxID=3154662 RepID=UPI00331CD227
MQKQAAKEAEERKNQTDQKPEHASSAEAASPSLPGPSSEANPARPAAAAERPAYRPQPFTPDLIPEPKEVEAEGELTAQETGDLENCEKAFSYADQAEWMRGKAAHAVRSRRLYRSGGRLWPEYCEEVLGQSESEANRMIQQWRLARAIFQLWTRPTPASHIQALLPAVDAYGEDRIAGGYVELRTWASENGTRVTAADLNAWAAKARAAAKKQLSPPELSAQTLTEMRLDRERRSRLAAPRQRAVGPGESMASARERTDTEEKRPTLNHPNLGDSIFNETTLPGVELEVDEERAVQAWSALEGMSESMVTTGILLRASTSTLEEIERTARRLADAAAEILKGR